MRSLIVVSLLALLLAACGQTGPLYLPKGAPKPPAAQAAKPQTAAAASTEQPATTDQPAAAVDKQVR